MNEELKQGVCVGVMGLALLITVIVIGVPDDPKYQILFEIGFWYAMWITVIALVVALVPTVKED